MFNNFAMRRSYRVVLLVLLFILFLPAISFARPAIFYTDILSGPNTGGENNNGAYLSIFGKGFGDPSGLGSKTKVYINNIEVASYKYLGPSIGRPDIQQISIQPGPAVTSGTIKVVVDGQSSHTDQTFTVRSGKIFFVALNGDDSTGVIGDITKPFRWPNDVFHRSDFLPGDFLVIRGGTWTQTGPGGTGLVGIDKDAAPNAAINPFTIYGYPGEEIIFDMTSLSYGIGYWIGSSDPNQDRDGYVIANFRIINSIDGVIDLGGNSANDKFENNDVRLINFDIKGGRNANTGIVVIGRANRTKVFGMRIDATYPTINNQHHHFYFSARTNDSEIGWIELFSSDTVNYNGGFALQVRASDYTAENDAAGEDFHSNISIHDSLFHDLPRLAVIWAESSGPGMKFYNNIIYNTGYYSGTTFAGILTADKNPSSFPVNEPSLELEVYNNIFYIQALNKPVLNLGFEKSLKIKNNIFVSKGSSQNFWYDTNGYNHNITSTNNIWYGNDSAIPSWDTNPIKNDPKFVDPANRDFHLQTNSPAIDAGVNTGVMRDPDGNSRPQGPAYDIGAYEYIIKPPSQHPIP